MKIMRRKQNAANYQRRLRFRVAVVARLKNPQDIHLLGQDPLSFEALQQVQSEGPITCSTLGGSLGGPSKAKHSTY